jgi:hypothetical protein
MQVICTNALNKPKQIPDNKWITEGEIYTVIGLVRLNLQANKVGLVLEEITLDESCFPYHYFDADRFAPLLDLDLTVAAEKEEVNLEEV